MSRRHRADKRDILPDPKFGNVVVTKFMNSVMHAGKKSVAENIVYGAFDIIEGKTRQNPVAVFEQALDNVMPSIEVRSRYSACCNGLQFAVRFRWYHRLDPAFYEVLADIVGVISIVPKVCLRRWARRSTEGHTGDQRRRRRGKKERMRHLGRDGAIKRLR